MSAIKFNNEILQYREKSNNFNCRPDFAIMTALNQNGGQHRTVCKKSFHCFIFKQNI